MYAIVAGQNMTELCEQETIERDETLGDPMTLCKMDIYDAASQIIIKPFKAEMLLLDDSPTALANPAWNLLLNPSTGANYFTSNSGAGPTVSYASSVCVFTYSNNGIGTFTNANQQIQLGLVTSGVAYMLSVYVVASAPVGLTNAAFITITYYDAGSNILSQTFTTITPTISQVRINAQAVAPVGTVRAVISLGGQSHTSTNSGTITYSTAQFEPVWFQAEGIVYPTPDCNPAQSNCYVLPNGTTIRQSRWFAGQVQSSNREYVYDGQASGPNRTHHLTCISPEWRLESSILINKSYTNMYDDQIIQDIVNTAFTVQATGTNQSNFTLLSTNHVQRTILISDTISFDGETVRAALNKICNLSNNVFSADYFYDLHYVPPSYNIQPFYLTDGQPNPTGNPPSYAMYEFNIDDDGSQLRNRVQVNGGNYSTPVQPPQAFSGDGATKEFTLNFQPDNMLSITVGGTQQNIKPIGQGTLGSGGLQVQWDKTTPKIKFFTAPPVGVNNVLVTYTYSSPVRVRTWEMQSISQYALYNQGLGNFDAKIEDSSLVTPSSAIQRGESEMGQFAYDLLTPHFKTNQPVNAGMLVPVYSALEQIGTPALLDSDSFARLNQSGFGTSSEGKSYTFTGASSANSIANNEGVIASTGGGYTHAHLGSATAQNQGLQCRIAINDGGDNAGIEARYASASGTSSYRLEYLGTLALRRVLAGVTTTLASAAFTMTPGLFYQFKLWAIGSSIFGKVWLDNLPEPANWTLSAGDINLTSGGWALLANSTNGPGIQFDHFSINNAISGPVPFLIQKVVAVILRGNADGAGILEYQCDAGAYQPNLVDLMRNTHKALNRSNKTATLPLLQETLVYRDTIAYSESFTQTSP